MHPCSQPATTASCISTCDLELRGGRAHHRRARLHPANPRIHWVFTNRKDGFRPFSQKSHLTHCRHWRKIRADFASIQGKTQFFPAGIIADVATSWWTMPAPLRARCTPRQRIVPNCLKIMRALATTGEVALIDGPLATSTTAHRMRCRADLPVAAPVLRIMGRRFHPTTTAPFIGCSAGSTRADQTRHVVGQITLRAGSTGRCCRMTCWANPQSQRHLAERPPVAVRSGTRASGIADSRGHGDCAQLDELSRLQAPLRGRLCWRCPAVGPAAR